MRERQLCVNEMWQRDLNLGTTRAGSQEKQGFDGPAELQLLHHFICDADVKIIPITIRFISLTRHEKQTKKTF